MQYPGIDGFLGTRASLMLDLVCLAMVGVLILLGLSVWLVKFRREFAWHKRLQLGLALALVVVVLLFEGDMRINGWQERAKASPYFASWVFPSLYVHLTFAVSSVALWAYVIAAALRRFDAPPTPNAYSPRHMFWARLAAFDMLLTALTGWLFYWLAFVAK